MSTRFGAGAKRNAYSGVRYSMAVSATAWSTREQAPDGGRREKPRLPLTCAVVALFLLPGWQPTPLLLAQEPSTDLKVASNVWLNLGFGGTGGRSTKDRVFVMGSVKWGSRTIEARALADSFRQ